MKDKLNLIHWVLVADIIVCIISHRIVLAQMKSGSVSGMLSNIFQITIYGALLFFMAACAGVAVYLWKKASSYGNDVDKTEFPKVSFTAAVAAFVIFSLYWTL